MVNGLARSVEVNSDLTIPMDAGIVEIDGTSKADAVKSVRDIEGNITIQNVMEIRPGRFRVAFTRRPPPIDESKFAVV